MFFQPQDKTERQKNARLWKAFAAVQEEPDEGKQLRMLAAITDSRKEWDDALAPARARDSIGAAILGAAYMTAAALVSYTIGSGGMTLALGTAAAASAAPVVAGAAVALLGVAATVNFVKDLYQRSKEEFDAMHEPLAVYKLAANMQQELEDKIANTPAVSPEAKAVFASLPALGESFAAFKEKQAAAAPVVPMRPGVPGRGLE